jgi:A/G-specific adenine glycosylase
MLVALDGGRVRLERRPEQGIWGGLWCLPEFNTASAAAAFVSNTLGTGTVVPQPLAELEHAFTHFDLRISPLMVQCTGCTSFVEENDGLWYNLREPARIGLPAPITALLARLADETLFDRSA